MPGIPWWLSTVSSHAGQGLSDDRELTSNTVISTGMMVPVLSCVRALYSLQKAMMLTPCAAQQRHT